MNGSIRNTRNRLKDSESSSLLRELENMPRLDTGRYFFEYHGHRISDLDTVLSTLQSGGKTSFIYLAGDSSLDNKHWFSDAARPCVNGYEQLLDYQKKDICYWINKECQDRGHRNIACINTAVEASTLNDRAFCCMWNQDKFIRDNITEDDYLIVSVGGNDIALAPLLLTIANILFLSCCVPQCCLEASCAYPPNLYIDGGCCMCGLPGCISGLVSWPPGIGYFVDMFKNRVGNYVRRLVSKRKPKKVLICMIYNPDEVAGGSWADGALCCLGYNVFPSRLQTLIRRVFAMGTSQIKIPGTEVVPFPLFQVLDGKNTRDYIQRVEPSPHGGQKMAKAFMDCIFDERRIYSDDRPSDL